MPILFYNLSFSLYLFSFKSHKSFSTSSSYLYQFRPSHFSSTLWPTLTNVLRHPCSSHSNHMPQPVQYSPFNFELILVFIHWTHSKEQYIIHCTYKFPPLYPKISIQHSSLDFLMYIVLWGEVVNLMNILGGSAAMLHLAPTLQPV
jgi:hypothetical protein